MQVQSTYRYARISAFKAREVTREIQGLPATDALSVLRFTPKKAAALISKTLKSAIANAENNNNLRVENLVVQEAIVGEGPTIKRFVPKARGSAGPIRKRTSHIKITLSDEIEIKRREPKKKSTGKAAKAAKPAKTASKKAEPAPAAEAAAETNE
jgi:large subunit ribosomal protein L22